MAELKTYYIIWDDIIFKKDQVAFDLRRLNVFVKPVKVAGIIESMNTLKGEYFKRLYGKKAFRLSFADSELVMTSEASPGWVRLFDAIELVQAHYEIKVARRKKGMLRNNIRLSRSEILDVYGELLSRTEYLKYLAQRSGDEYKLLPILEYCSGNIEDSFLFRYKNKKGDALIIWENVNPNRATYIFKYNEDKHPDLLLKLESFISTGEYSQKRSLLSGNDRPSKLIRRDLCFYKKYTHQDLMDYRAEIEYVINYS